MKKIILSLATTAFIGFGGSAVSAGSPPPTPLPNVGSVPIECAEWDGVSAIPEICVDFYFEEATTTTPATTTTTTEVATGGPTTTTTTTTTLAPTTTTATASGPTTTTTTIATGSLPRTGSGVSPILGIGALLFVGGGIVVVATRRRSTSTSPAS